MFGMILGGSQQPPIWLIAEGVLVLATLTLLLAVRSTDLPFTQRQQQQATRIVLVVALCGLVIVWAGGGLLQSLTASALEQTMPHPTPTVGAMVSADQTPMPTVGATVLADQTPTPLPTLPASAIGVLQTLCGAINRQDTTTILQDYVLALQHTVLANRTILPKGEQVKFLRCLLADSTEQLPVGILLFQTEDGNGYADGYARPFQFVMVFSEGTWKVKTINYCMSDGCVSFTGRITL
jgi:hypothetical protein